MESQPQNPEFKINPESFHPFSHEKYDLATISITIGIFDMLYSLYN